MRATATLLKQHTAQCHQRVESGLNLLDPLLDERRLGEVVARLAGFWLGTEPALDAWASAHPEQAALVQWPRRRRGERMRADLVRLGCDASPDVAAPVFEHLGDAEVLGWLYVAEGSTLGGAVLERRLQSVLRGTRLASFTPYDEGPGPMWRDYLAALDAWTGSDELRTERVVAASVTTFDALWTWVSPISVEAAA